MTTSTSELVVDFGAARPCRVSAPLARMLGLSLALHLALIQLVAVTPGESLPYTFVVNARLTRFEPAAVAPAAPSLAESPADTAARRTGPARPGVPAPPLARAATERDADAVLVPANVPEPARLLHGDAVPSASAPSLPASAVPEAVATVAAPMDLTWYETRALDVPPKVLAGPRPAYPETARRAGLEGEVLLALRIDETGVVREARLVSASPPEVFDAAALAAYGAARFTPARLNGRAVRAEVRLRALFRLDD